MTQTTLGLLIALGAGIAVGLQGLLTSTLGSQVGALRGGWLIHVGGLITGGGMVLMLSAARGGSGWELNARTALLALAAGTAGMCILFGIAESFPRVGQVTGQATIIFGQMGIALIVDALGLLSEEPIPIDARRIIGLLVMALAVWLLLPRADV